MAADDLDNLIGTAGGLPTPSAHVPELIAVEQSTPPAAAAGDVAAAASSASSAAASTATAGGEQFDPSRHATDAAGFPKMRADGRGFQLRRGRKTRAQLRAERRAARGSAASSPAAAAGDVGGCAAAAAAGDDAGELASLPPGEAPDGSTAAERQAAAVRTADVFFAVGGMVGPFVNARTGAPPADWTPQPAERDRVINAVRRYFDKHGIIADLPPGLALVGAVALYVVPRSGVVDLAGLAGGAEGEYPRATDTAQAA